MSDFKRVDGVIPYKKKVKVDRKPPLPRRRVSAENNPASEPKDILTLVLAGDSYQYADDGSKIEVVEIS
jgi:hypothetical protein